MKRRADSGTVSIYFIVVTAAFLFLTALLIDFSRIASFRYHTELAVQSGVRSVLSSFDPLLYQRYGLFVRGGEDAGELLRTTAEGHFSKPDQGSTFPYLDAEWTAVDVTESRPLADHDVFLRQVMEEMKYKAPIDLTLEFADRFRGIAPALKQAAATVDMLDKMREAYDRREAALDEALAAQRQGGEQTVSLLQSLAPYPPVPVNGSMSAGHVRHAADAAMQYEDYAAKRQQAAMDTEDTAETNEVSSMKRLRANAIGEYESSVASLAVSLATAAGRVRTTADETFSSAEQARQRAQEANEQMAVIVTQAQSLPSGGAGDSTAGSSAETGPDAVAEVDAGSIRSMAELRSAAEELLLDDGYFEQYAIELGNQRSAGQRVAEEANSFSALASSAAGSTGMGVTLREAADRLGSQLREYAGDYGGKGTVTANRRRLLDAHRSGDEERKAEERKARSEWSGLTGFMSAFSGHSGSEADRRTFDQAAGLARDNLAWNRMEADNQQAVTMTGDPAAARNAAMSGAGGLMDALHGSLTGVRDQLYFSEFVTRRLTRFPPSEVKRMLEGAQVPLPLDRQETEFVLYGFHNTTGNIAAAYGEILSMRLAIRTMEGLIECKAMGHPLVVLAAASVYAIRNTLLDMNRLLERDSVPLSKHINVQTTYADYLRLFLLLHGGSAGHLARSIAVIEQASGISFSRAYTYISGEGTASLRLWFFPGLLKAMGRAGQLGGAVKGNRYEASYTADSSYQ